jgi:hypothetical protein
MLATAVSDPIEGELPGLARRFERLAADGSDDDAITEALVAEHAADELATAGGRGLETALRAAVAALRDRREISDLGRHEVTVPWLSFHVPAGGSAELKLASSGAEKSALTLKLVGAGYGRVRTLTWEQAFEIPSRTTCMRSDLHVTLDVRLFEVRTALGRRREAGADVVGTRREMVSLAQCPHCGIGVDEVEPFEFASGDVLDQRGFDTSVVETGSTTVSTEAVIDAAFDAKALPVLEGLSLGLSLTRSIAARLDTKVTLAPGRRYLPYWPLDGGVPQLPFWAST